ncbi:MAG: extracellular solute-binding protein [Clostridia bacterium]
MMKKRRFLIGILGIALALLTACAPAGKVNSTMDVWSQKSTVSDKTPITVLVKYAFSINCFEKAAEEYFPTLDLIQVGNFTSNSGFAEYEARMEHDDLPDMVMTWPLETGMQHFEERLIDLSAMPFTSRYINSKLNEISRNGKLYYLPGPSQIRGIVYNKTLFEEKGWALPTDFESFLALCQTIEADGIRSLQLGLGNPEVLDTAFVGYGYASCYNTPEDVQWIVDYNNGKGSFGDHFAPALSTFELLIDKGVLQAKDLEITYAERERMLFHRQCAMIEDSVLLARMGGAMTGTTDEFALMPFFNPGEEGDWARLYPVCYIGLNKHLTEPQNKEKYDLVLDLMDYISTPEGQLALAGDTGGMFSSLNGAPLPDVPEIDALLPALHHGRCARFPTLQNAQNALRKGLAGMVNGTLTANDVARLVDAENLAPAVPPPPTVLGKATADFTMIETGNLITDVMREKSGCEIALFLDNGKDGLYNGKGICAKLYRGEITSVDIQRLLPDTKTGERIELQKVTMTGENLLRTLEYAIPVNDGQCGWFYYFSGLRMIFDPCAAPGQRIQQITDENGKPIELQKSYTIAIMDTIVPQAYCQSIESTGILIQDLLSDAIVARKTISPSEDGRFILPNSCIY